MSDATDSGSLFLSVLGSDTVQGSGSDHESEPSHRMLVMKSH
jgi:hypothetical protein